MLPVTLHEENLLGIYVRNYGNSVLATPERIRDMVLLSDNNPFDQPFIDEKFENSEFSKLFSMYQERTGGELTEKALIFIGFMNNERNLSKGRQSAR